MSDKRKLNVDDLVNEIIDNARSDRERLVNYAEGLRRFVECGAKSNGGDAIDPEVALALSEQISRVSDSLTKINQQFIQIVQIDAKKSQGDLQGDGKLTKKEREELFLELEQH